MKTISDDRVNLVFGSYPIQYQKVLLMIRELIFRTAAENKKVGTITETLKWGQPSYQTIETGSGTTIRIGRFNQSSVALFVHCQTTLIDSFRTLFPELNYSKNRAIILDINEALPIKELAICIEMALTYKLRNKTA
ncbi:MULTISPECIES: DUF1801 domain-containing protein [Providencia]|uniref:DUF1801 domain-containing protein n=3 Tax=Providencia TaxID=586 RepID=A0AA42FIP4_9GAMM|nr:MULTISPECIES: DUF1801 domain-containing protein [Providencia]AVL75266.1 DUF1801 domain-containing protein [Providencia rettgeri]EIU7554979.1 DUF1801 domain-containing protein [Providencia rettgeri]EJD6041331.1 DUF1801 domain-containing protein [Providencia rettgeri]EJD6081099.1 DUF1801 domain-containing protein [Providencia rettgeri]EJD6371012.1 DUF1801 domain-containing protein [Providencia rettgeri]